MRKLTAVTAALALTGLAACDSIQPGAPAPTSAANVQQGQTQPAINPALLPAGAFQGNVAAAPGSTPQQGQSQPAINPALLPAATIQGGTPTAGVTPQQGERQAINPALVQPRR
jgi:hypothetical protein